MEIIEADRFFQALATGTEPTTGEQIPPGSPFLEPRFQEALAAAVAALRIAADRARRAAAQPPNLGKPWSAEEDARLAAHFVEHVPIKEIAAAHGRTVGSIESRLQKLGHLAPGERTTRDRY